MKNYKNSLKSKGFTLIELLLIAVVLSTIAVSTAPLLLNGANESLSQARKNEFLKAYQNTMTGAQMMVTLANNYNGDNWKPGWNIDQHPIVFRDKEGKENNIIGKAADNKIWNKREIYRTLGYYIPSARRQFINNKGVKFTLSATIIDNHGVIVVCKACTNNIKEYFGKKLTDGDQYSGSYHGYPIYIVGDRRTSLERFWEFVANLDETTKIGQQNDSETKNEWNRIKVIKKWP